MLTTAVTDLKEFQRFEQRPFIRERNVFWKKRTNWTRFYTKSSHVIKSKPMKCEKQKQTNQRLGNDKEVICYL